jgi:hypothetical protein
MKAEYSTLYGKLVSWPASFRKFLRESSWSPTRSVVPAGIVVGTEAAAALVVAALGAAEDELLSEGELDEELLPHAARATVAASREAAKTADLPAVKRERTRFQTWVVGGNPALGRTGEGS